MRLNIIYDDQRRCRNTLILLSDFAHHVRNRLQSSICFLCLKEPGCILWLVKLFFSSIVEIQRNVGVNSTWILSNTLFLQFESFQAELKGCFLSQRLIQPHLHYMGWPLLVRLQNYISVQEQNPDYACVSILLSMLLHSNKLATSYKIRKPPVTPP